MEHVDVGIAPGSFVACEIGLFGDVPRGRTDVEGSCVGLDVVAVRVGDEGLVEGQRVGNRERVEVIVIQASGNFPPR